MPTNKLNIFRRRANFRDLIILNFALTKHHVRQDKDFQRQYTDILLGFKIEIKFAFLPPPLLAFVV